MSMQPYVLVLAQTSHEGSKYVRRAKLPRGRWRIVARASSIQGIRKAEVHCLPGFHKRPDKHSILGVLRYAQCEWKDVEMPPREVPDAVDQGDGMGEQLTIEEALVLDDRPKPGEVLAPEEIAELEQHLEPEGWEPPEVLNAEQILRLAAGESGADVAPTPEPVEDDIAQERPANKRRRKCADCSTLHFKDEPCARLDGVEEPPVVTPATMFD